MKRIVVVIGILIMGLCSCTIAMAQESDKKVEGDMYNPKKPLLALGLGLVVPGGGHLYAGELKTGFTLLGIGSGGLAVSTIAWSHAQKEGGVDDYIDAGLYSAAGSLVYLGALLYSVIDAPKAARRKNEEHGLSAKGVRIEPTFLTVDRAQTTYGIKVSIRL